MRELLLRFLLLFLPIKAVWVRDVWGDVGLFRCRRLVSGSIYIKWYGRSKLVAYNWDGEMKTAQDFVEWAYYRHWWEKKLPPLPEERSDIIELNKRAKKAPDERFRKA